MFYLAIKESNVGYEVYMKSQDAMLLLAFHDYLSGSNIPILPFFNWTHWTHPSEATLFTPIGAVEYPPHRFASEKKRRTHPGAHEEHREE